MDPENLPSLPAMPERVLAGRIPAWRTDALVHRRCPVCDVDPPEALCIRPDGLAVGRCPRCGMVYVPDIPDEQQLREFYRRYAEYKTCLLTRPSMWYRLSPMKPPDPHIEILRRSGGLGNKRLCEVGCSSGLFLRRAMDEGAAVFGLEIDETALAALERQGIPASRSLAAGSAFDILCAFQVIEHLADPAGWMKEVSQALAPDGRVLLALPNGDEATRIGPGWLGFRVDLEHLNFFGAGTLARLMGRFGIYIEHFWESGQPSVPRSPEPRGPARWAVDLVSRLVTRPSQSDGTFVLTVLARKAGAP